MAYYNFKRVRDALPREMVEKWLREDGTADYDSTLWALAAEYIEQLKKERDDALLLAEYGRRQENSTNDQVVVPATLEPESKNDVVAG